MTSLVSSVATIEAMWTKGPSFPKGIPEPSVAVRPTTFATSVLYKEEGRSVINHSRCLKVFTKFKIILNKAKTKDFILMYISTRIKGGLLRDFFLRLENGNSSAFCEILFLILENGNSSQAA